MAALTAAIIVIASALIAGTTGVASAAETGPAATTTGVEILFGTSNSTANTPIIPLIATGVVNGYGFLNTAGPTNGVSTLTFDAGNLRVYHVRHTSSSHNYPAACKVTFSESGSFTVLGGSRAFAGGSGQGAYGVTGWVIFPRKGGKCDPNAPPKRAFNAFAAIGVITVRT